MKRLFFAIALVAVSCLSMSACATDSKKESNSESMSDCATAKPEAPERQGWLEDVPLYGDVESVVVTTYNLEDKFGEVVRGDIEDCEKYYFNKAGDVFEKAEYNSYGSLDWKIIYKYDASGNMIEDAWYNSEGSLIEKYIYKYDASGNRIEETKYRGEALLPISQTVYEITYRK